MEKVLVFQTRPGVGDMCIFLTYIRTIARYKKCEITLITKKRTSAKDLLYYDNVVKEVIYIDEKKSLKNKIKIFLYLKSKRFNSVFIYHYGIKFYILSKILNIKNILFYGFLKKNVNIIQQAESATQDWLKLKNTKFKPELKFEKVKNVKNNTIIIGIGGSGITKKWLIDNYIELMMKIINQKKYNFIIAGGPEETQDAKKIIKYFEKNKNIQLTSLCNSSILESIEKILYSSLYIGNDTGFMHISGCLGIKTYGLFGDTPSNYSDYNNNIIPILPKNSHSIGHDSLSMHLITVEHVYNNILLDI